MAHVEHKEFFFFGDNAQVCISVERTILFDTALIKVKWWENGEEKEDSHMLDYRTCKVLMALLAPDK